MAESPETDVDAQIQQDLRFALKAAKELIESLREYSNNLATQVDEKNDQINMLKERLHEHLKDPVDEKQEQVSFFFPPFFSLSSFVETEKAPCSVGEGGSRTKDS